MGSLSGIISEKTIGKIDEDKKNGIQTFAKPVGIIASLTPSTNAAATPRTSYNVFSKSWKFYYNITISKSTKNGN